MTARYSEIRAQHVLVQHDAQGGALTALLRFDGVEVADTRHRLRTLGFQPSASPMRAPVSFRRQVSNGELRAMGVRLNEVLGELPLLDLGATFSDDAARPSQRTAGTIAWWPGQFLLHIGGTRRCLVFAPTAHDADLVALILRAREHYFAHDFQPVTE